MATSPFSVIAGSTVTIAGNTYCAENVNTTRSAEVTPYTCLGSATASAAVSGAYTWGGTLDLIFDDTNMAALQSQDAPVTCVISIKTSNSQVLTITATDGIIVTSVPQPVQHAGGVIKSSVTFVGAGTYSGVTAAAV